MTKVSSFNQYVGNKMNYIATKTFIAKSLEKGLKHPAEYAAKMMVLSLVSKDAVNCAFYTYQSLNNEKIPKEKRGFVAALDFVNGIINVGGQLAAFALVDRYFTPWLETKYTGVYKHPRTKVETILPESNAPIAPDRIYQDTEHVIGSRAAEIKEELKKVKGCKITYADIVTSTKTISEDLVKKVGHSGSRGKDIATGLGIVVTALATTALIKRTLTPLIATPLAGKLKDKFKEKESQKPENDSDKMLEATYKPWLTKAPENKNDLVQDKFQKSTPKQA